MPATAGGSTIGSSTSVTSAPRPRKRRASRYASGVPSTRIAACAIALVSRLTTSASVTTGFESWSTSRPGGSWVSSAASGSARNASASAARGEEDERDEQASQRRPRVTPTSSSSSACGSAIFSFGFVSGRKPKESSLAWPALLRTSVMNAFAAAWLGLLVTTAMA